MWKKVSNPKRCAVLPVHNITTKLSNIQACEAGTVHFLQNFFRWRFRYPTRQESNGFFASHKPNILIDSYCVAEKVEQLIPAEFSAYQGLRAVSLAETGELVPQQEPEMGPCWGPNKGQKPLSFTLTAVQQDLAFRGSVLGI